MLLIFYLSSQPQPLPAVTEHVWDKALHFIEYAVLGALLCRAFRGEGLAWIPALAAAALLASAYGASDEWHQSFVPLRDASVRDWWTDLLGGTAGAGGYGRFSRPLRRPRLLRR
jgi:VanZ family protein